MTHNLLLVLFATLLAIFFPLHIILELALILVIAKLIIDLQKDS